MVHSVEEAYIEDKKQALLAEIKVLADEVSVFHEKIRQIQLESTKANHKLLNIKDKYGELVYELALEDKCCPLDRRGRPIRFSYSYMSDVYVSLYWEEDGSGNGGEDYRRTWADVLAYEEKKTLKEEEIPLRTI